MQDKEGCFFLQQPQLTAYLLSFLDCWDSWRNLKYTCKAMKVFMSDHESITPILYQKHQTFERLVQEAIQELYQTKSLGLFDILRSIFLPPVTGDTAQSSPFKSPIREYHLQRDQELKDYLVFAKLGNYFDDKTWNMEVRHGRFNKKLSQRVEEHLQLLFKKTRNTIDPQVTTQAIALIPYVNNKKSLVALMRRHLLLCEYPDGAESILHQMKGKLPDTLLLPLLDIAQENRSSLSIMAKAVEEQVVPQEFTCRIFSSLHWSGPQKEPEFVVPTKLRTLQEPFTRFYMKEFPGRKLQWLNSKTTVEASLHSADKEYILVLTVPQLAILEYCMNGKEKEVEAGFDTAQVQSDLGMDHALFGRAIEGLVYHQLLDKYCELSRLLFLSNFESKCVRVNVAKEVPNENATYVMNREQLPTDAAIVRILKSMGTCPKEDLLQLVVRELSPRFEVPMRVVFRRVQLLIEKEYIRETSDAWHYIP